MDLKVQRKHSTPQSTTGELSIDGVFFCYTLEPRQDQSKGKPYAIPTGKYEVKLLPSHRFNMVTPHVLKVPGFEAIEIHPGNYPKDTEGCTLVGSTLMEDYVGDSRKTFKELMAILKAPIYVEYTNPLLG